MKILLVEDEEIIREMIRQILLASGYEVVTAENGLEALKIFEKSQIDFDLVITDFNMPQMNGREVFRHAVSKLPATVRTACEKAGLALSEIDWFIGHQANERINTLVRERLNVPAEKMPSNIARYGNTSSATIPIPTTATSRSARARRRRGRRRPPSRRW